MFHRLHSTMSHNVSITKSVAVLTQKEQLHQKLKETFKLFPKQYHLHSTTVLTMCGVMTALPGLRFISKPGSMSTPMKSKPTRPVFISVSSATASWS